MCKEWVIVFEFVCRVIVVWVYCGDYFCIWYVYVVKWFVCSNICGKNVEVIVGG